MRFETTALAGPTDFIKRAIDREATKRNAIFGTIHIRADSGIVALRGNDLDISTACTVEVDVGEGGEVAVSAEKLAGLMGGLAKATVNFATEGTTLKISSGRSHYHLETIWLGHLPESFALATDACKI